MFKKIIRTTFVLILSGLFSFTAAQSKMDVLKARKEVLKLNTRLNNLKIDLQKEKRNNAKYAGQVDSYNTTAEKFAGKFSPSEDPKVTAKNARKAEKKLKAAAKSNVRLLKSNRKIEDIESDIADISRKIANLDHQLKFKGDTVEPTKNQ